MRTAQIETRTPSPAVRSGFTVPKTESTPNYEDDANRAEQDISGYASPPSSPCSFLEHMKPKRTPSQSRARRQRISDIIPVFALSPAAPRVSREHCVRRSPARRQSRQLARAPLPTTSHDQLLPPWLQSAMTYAGNSKKKKGASSPLPPAPRAPRAPLSSNIPPPWLQQALSFSKKKGTSTSIPMPPSPRKKGHREFQSVRAATPQSPSAWSRRKALKRQQEQRVQDRKARLQARLDSARKTATKTERKEEKE